MPNYDKTKSLRALAQAESVAIVMAPRLGDSLLMMTMAQNLALAGRNVSIFGNYVHMLRDWFPDFEIQGDLAEADAARLLPGFDCVVQMHDDWPHELHNYGTGHFYYDMHVKVTGRGFVKLFQIRDFCRDELGLGGAGIDNGMRPLIPSQHRVNPNRVVLHPTSTGEQRCWAPQHFKELGLRLKAEGFEPNYIVSPQERNDWLWLLDHGLNLPDCGSMSGVASFIHASGWFIGNESGIGHLASNLGVPTLSLTGRPTRTKAWQPSWTTSRIVYPSFIPGGRWRDRFWRHWLSPRSVMSAFHRLQADDQQKMPAMRAPD